MPKYLMLTTLTDEGLKDANENPDWLLYVLLTDISTTSQLELAQPPGVYCRHQG